VDLAHEDWGGAFVDVAVIDTGVDATNLDLLGRVEEYAVYDYETPVPVDSYDSYGHGTHVCGTIAADAGYARKGIYGVAPEADLHMYDVFTMGGYVDTAVIRAVDLGAEVISMSIGFGISDIYGNWVSSNVIIDVPSLYPELHAALLYAYYNDVLSVASAGNERDTLELDSTLVTYELPSIGCPAASSWVVAVGAIDPHKEPAFFSSSGLPGSSDIGRDMVEVAAPGVGLQLSGAWYRGYTPDDIDYIHAHYPTYIFSTFPTYPTGYSSYYGARNAPPGYAWMMGTSMACPHVSGLAAKLWQGSAEATRGYLRSIAQDIWESGYDVATGLGLPVVPSSWVDVPWWWRIKPV